MINNLNFGSVNKAVESLSLEAKKAFNASSSGVLDSASTVVKDSLSDLQSKAASNIAALAMSAKKNDSSISSALKKMNDQLIDVTSDEINKIISKIPNDDKDFVFDLMNSATQYGNLDSLNSLYKSVAKYKESGYEFYSFTDNPVNGILSNFSYFARKKAFAENPATDCVKKEIFEKNKGAFIVDSNFIERLQMDPELCDHIKNNDFKLIYPEGWNKGITAYNLTTVEDITDRAIELNDLALSFQRKGKTQKESIEEALNYDVKEKLNQLGLLSKLDIVKNERIANSKQINPEKISENLASRKMTLEELERVLPARENEKNAALTILENDAKTVSMREFGISAKKLHLDVQQLANEKGIDKDDIFYLIPLQNKSYNVVGLQYQQINGVSEKQFIYGIKNIPDSSKKRMIVILDDYAGSGTSVKEAYKYLRNKCSDDIVMATHLSTDMANKILTKAFKDDAKCSFMPGKIINSYFNTPEYAAKRRSDYYTYSDLIGKSSFGMTEENIALPYMAPDNNIKFFADSIAKHYTLNSAGVRVSGGN